MVVCPIFGHPAQTFTKYKFLQVKNNLQKFLVDCQFWNCFSIRMVIYYFSGMPTAIASSKRKHIVPKLGQGVKVHFPNPLNFKTDDCSPCLAVALHDVGVVLLQQGVHLLHLLPRQRFDHVRSTYSHGLDLGSHRLCLPQHKLIKPGRCIQKKIWLQFVIFSALNSPLLCQMKIATYCFAQDTFVLHLKLLKCEHSNNNCVITIFAPGPCLRL